MIYLAITLATILAACWLVERMAEECKFHDDERIS